MPLLLQKRVIALLLFESNDMNLRSRLLRFLQVMGKISDRNTRQLSN
ncbi:MAG: hypothetical protein ACK5XC_19440 [Pseudanabaena sp.]